MIQTPVIVTFSNQKGGVGKTTLCATFANYLVTMGVKVRIVDCDAQHSIIKSRKADIRKYGTGNLPYEVWPFEVNDGDRMTTLMEKVRNDTNVDVVLMDSPGGISAPGLIPMYVNSDYIIVPFHYDPVTIPSTASFLLLLDQLRKTIAKMKADVFAVPNLIDGRVGKKAELVVWEKTREAFSRHGKVTGKIPRRADMERFSTITALDLQVGIVNPVFTEIYTEIFGGSEPYRQAELSGIQLNENLKRLNEKTDTEVSPRPSEPDGPEKKPEADNPRKEAEEADKSITITPNTLQNHE